MSKPIPERARRPLPFRMALRAALTLALTAAAGFAVETKFWRQEDRSDFEKGSLQKLSLRSDGRLFLAPEFTEIFDSSTPYLWTAAADAAGNVYTAGGRAGGDAAKLFVVDAQGRGRALAELEGLEIHALAIDRGGRVFAATDPDGKVYRLGAGGKAELFYDPRAKYIWAMAFDGKGNLYVATGDDGQVHRVSPDGKGSVFFRTEETHARSLAVDAHDNLIVGTEPGGLILRVSPAGEGFVLYQTPKREITSVAVAADGAVYAAAVGNKASTSPLTISPAPAAPAPAAPSGPPTAAITVAPATLHPATPPPTFGAGAPAILGGSEVYRILPDGSPRKVWANAQDLVYAIGFDAAGKPLFGTGNNGRIYRLDSDTLSTLLLDASPTQVTGFASGPGGKLYAITGNIGKLYQIGPGLPRQGSYQSEAFDAGSFSYWGRLGFRGAPPSAAVLTRSGNVNRPQANWSAWTPLQSDGEASADCALCGGGRIASPPARFLQYKIELTGGAASLSSVEIAYLPKNVAPVVEQVEITPPNYRFPVAAAAAAATASAASANINLPPLGPRKRVSAPSADLSSPSAMSYAKGFIGVRWAASDENGDALAYKVEIRGAGESVWKVLKDNAREKSFSWDSGAFPDGDYVVRVTATDAPANPPGQELASSLESDPFLIDNTPPRISRLTAARSANGIEVRWSAHDDRGNIDKAEYSLNGGEWLLVEPVTRLSDSPSEEYRLLLKSSGAGEQIVAVRVSDQYDNQAVGKVVIK